MHGVLWDWPSDPFVSKGGKTEWVEDSIGGSFVAGSGGDLETFSSVFGGWGDPKGVS